MFITEAWAQAGAPQGADIMQFGLPLLMIGFIYFLMVRPQMKRAKEHKSMVEAMQKGDEVVAAGGVIGKISKVDSNYVTLQIADNVEIHVQRMSVQLVLPKGTIKGIG